MPTNVLDILRFATQLMIAGNAAVPLIASVITGLAQRLDPTLKPSQVIDLLEEELRKNHERNVTLVQEIRDSMVPAPSPEG